jgi:type 1 fimbria pilin
MTPKLFSHCCLVLLAWCIAPWASAEYYHNQCNFITGDNATSSMTFSIPLGDYYVPRDAPVGTPIGSPFTYKAAPNAEGLALTCNRAGTAIPNPPFHSNLIAVGAVFPGTLPNIQGRDLTGKVFLTSVPGVGVALEMESPYLGGAQNQFTSTTGTRLPPLQAINDYPTMPIGIHFERILVRALLVKIGNIPAGINTIAPNTLFKGDFTGTPNAFSASVTGTVRQAQCTLSPSDPVSHVPVPLGTWSTDDFSGPGSVTTAVPFHINLLDCESNPGADEFGFATAHIKLEGALGSSVIDKDLGLFSLDTTATATGVGIQVLRADGSTPMPLNEAVPVSRIAPSGAMQLGFQCALSSATRERSGRRRQRYRRAELHDQLSVTPSLRPR